MEDRLRQLTFFLLLAMSIAAGLLIFLSLSHSNSVFVTMLTGLMMAIFAVTFIFFNLKVFRNNPTTLTVALLGFPRTGKTVYLTILFNSLQEVSSSRIKFSPYGVETVEKVTSDSNSLSRQLWLGKTKDYNVFYYRALVTLKNIFFAGLIDKRFKLEIADFPGEKLEEMSEYSDRWLHKSEFFQYVIQSDVLFIAIDVESATKFDSDSEIIQNSFIAALHILIEKKGIPEHKKMQAPVAILFLKSDLLKSEDEENYVLIRYSRLISVCKNRCKNFNHFFVSSTGKLNSDGSPPYFLTPSKVIDPIYWSLNRSK